MSRVLLLRAFAEKVSVTLEGGLAHTQCPEASDGSGRVGLTASSSQDELCQALLVYFLGTHEDLGTVLQFDSTTLAHP